MTRGIILLSLGSPYYARMAANLAYSLKATCPEIPIHLVTNNSIILNEPSPEDLKYFDTIAYADKSIYEKDGKCEYFRAKTCLYDLSPFDETIYLDVDMVALPTKTMAQLFAEMEHDELSIACRGSEDISTIKEDISQWANIPELVKIHNITQGSWYQLSSEFIYFKKTLKNKNWFDTAREFYDEPKANFLSFGGCMADELAFGMACLITGDYPSVDQFTPIYWCHGERNRPVKKIDPFVVENYYGYSMGHAYNDMNQKAFYNNMMQFYYNKMGRRGTFFPAQNKKLFVPDREKI